MRLSVRMGTCTELLLPVGWTLTVHLYLLCVGPALPKQAGLAVLALNTWTRLLQGPSQHSHGTCDGLNVSWELFSMYALAACPKTY